MRKKRKSMIVGFVQHVLYMTLLLAVFMLQHGSSVSNRFMLVDTLKGFVRGLSTPSGVTFDSISSIDEVWDWTENAFFDEFTIRGGAGNQRVYARHGVPNPG
jgi:hypothetical protein